MFVSPATRCTTPISRHADMAATSDDTGDEVAKNTNTNANSNENEYNAVNLADSINDGDYSTAQKDEVPEKGQNSSAGLEGDVETAGDEDGENTVTSVTEVDTVDMDQDQEILTEDQEIITKSQEIITKDQGLITDESQNVTKQLDNSMSELGYESEEEEEGEEEVKDQEEGEQVKENGNIGLASVNPTLTRGESLDDTLIKEESDSKEDSSEMSHDGSTEAESENDVGSESESENLFADDITEEEFAALQYEAQLSLAQRLRPRSLDEYIGQLQLVGERGSVAHYFDDNNINKIRSLILWGPPGVGKTSLAKIIIRKAKLTAYEFSASLDSISHIKPIIQKLDSKKKFIATPEEELRNRVILFVDEIHRFSKTQQDFLLDAIDRNLIVLIGATTENPSFSLVRPLLSRCLMLTLEAHSLAQVESVILKGVDLLNRTRRYVFRFPEIQFAPSAVLYLAKISNGDLRNALKLLELAFLTLTRFDPVTKHVIHEERTVHAEDLQGVVDKKFINFDAKGDQHYDTISAFHKAVRGSDTDAALYYLMRMLKGGDDPLYICRRIVRIASEDIGTADHSCLPYCAGVYEAVLRLGLPKSLKLLVECTMRIARTPKSVEIYRGWNMAKEVARDNPDITIPFHLTGEASNLYNRIQDKRDGTDRDHDPKYYKHNLEYSGGIVHQTYLPEELKDVNVFFGRDLGDAVDSDLGNEHSDSEPDFQDDDFYHRRKRIKVEGGHGDAEVHIRREDQSSFLENLAQEKDEKKSFEIKQNDDSFQVYEDGPVKIKQEHSFRQGDITVSTPTADDDDYGQDSRVLTEGDDTDDDCKNDTVDQSPASMRNQLLKNVTGVVGEQTNNVSSLVSADPSLNSSNNIAGTKLLIAEPEADSDFDDSDDDDDGAFDDDNIHDDDFVFGEDDDDDEEEEEAQPTRVTGSLSGFAGSLVQSRRHQRKQRFLQQVNEKFDTHYGVDVGSVDEGKPGKRVRWAAGL